MKTKNITFLTFLDKMQFSEILCLATYDWFCADGSHLCTCTFRSTYSRLLGLPKEPVANHYMTGKTIQVKQFNSIKMFNSNKSSDPEHIEIAKTPACLYTQIRAFYNNY